MSTIKVGRRAQQVVSSALILTSSVWLSGVAYLAAPLSVSAQMAACSSYSFSVDLAQGARSNEVSRLQQFLSDCSSYYPEKLVTGYYGSLTAAAVARLQAANGILGNNGVNFGPRTRAAANALASGAPAAPAAPSDAQAALIQQLLQLFPESQRPAMLVLLTGLLGGSAAPAPVGAGLSVSLAPSSPASGTVVSGGAQMPVLAVRFQAGSSDVTVSGLKFRKTGVVSDSGISNAYIAEGVNILAQYQSLSGGVVSFSGNLFTVPANSYRDVLLRVDLATGLSSGNTLGFYLDPADVTASAAVSGNRASGASLTVTNVTNPVLATLSFAWQSVASQVDPGTQGLRIAALSASVSNSPVRLHRMLFTVTGSINLASDVQNYKLFINGVQQGSTIAAANASGQVNFDLSAAPVVLQTGSTNIEVYADVVGGPSRNFTVNLLRPYEVTAEDTQYNTFITNSVSSGTPQQVNIRNATAILSLNAATPTGNVAKGATNVTIAKFDLRAVGEAIKVKWLPFTITLSNASGVLDSNIKDIAIYDDVGGQVGSTITTASSGVKQDGSAATFAGGVYTASFGSSGSPINYIVPANTTRILSLRLNLLSTATTTSLRGALIAASPATNIEGQVSFVSAGSGAQNGALLQVATVPFYADINSAYANQTFVFGANNARIGSFLLQASSAEAVDVSSVSVSVDNVQGSNTLALQNVRAQVGAVQWGLTTASVTDGQTITFAGSAPIRVPAGGNVVFDIYGDILSTSNQAVYTSVFDMTQAQGVGVDTRTSLSATNSAGNSISGGLAGQNITVAGAGSLTVAVDASVPNQQAVLGNNGLTLARFIFTAGSNEDVRLTDLKVTVTANASTTPVTLQNLTLWEGSTQVASGISLAHEDNSSRNSGTFHFATPIVIAKNSSKTLTLKGDFASYQSSPSSHNTTHQPQIFNPVTDVTAVGESSQANVTINGGSTTAVSSGTFTALRTRLYVASSQALGATSGRARQAVDDVAQFTLSVDNAFASQLASSTNGIILTFSGGALTGSGAQSSTTVSLIDTDTGAALANSSCANMALGSATGVANCTLSAPFLIGAGSSKTLKVRINSNNLGNTGSVSDSLSVQIANAADIDWYPQGEQTVLGLESRVIPIQLASVSYE